MNIIIFGIISSRCDIHGNVLNIRLRAVPFFSYSPSRAERKKPAARKLATFSTDYEKKTGLLVV